MTEKRSPLKEKPLRNPGESVDEQRTEVLLDKFLEPAMIAILLVMVAGLEWVRVLADLPLAPKTLTFFALLGIVYAGYRMRSAIGELKSLRLARDGEKTVGQFLEALRAAGYQVFHDVLGPGFNIDHVLIGPAGVYTIETKTYRKLPGPDVKVRFDGQQLTVDGLRLDRDPVVQAKAQASWLGNLLEESTGRRFRVRPVVLFPGWFIEQTTEGSTREVWVLNPKAFPKFLNSERAILDVEAISQASLHLSRVVRTT